MYVAPIEFNDVRHWFLNVDNKFHHLCLFLTGNGDYNEIINEEILDNKYLIDRATGDDVCYFFCSSFGFDGDIVDFNRWNVRNRERSMSITNALQANQRRRVDNRTPSPLQSELLREDACTFYHISRLSLPALVFISKKEEVFVYPINGFSDNKALLTPLGIISDYIRDKNDLEYQASKIRGRKLLADWKAQRYRSLVKATKDAIPKSEYAQKLIEEILEICREKGIDESTINKMKAYPEKIRQILSRNPVNSGVLSDKIHQLRDCISQYRIVKNGSLSILQAELEELSGTEYEEFDDDIADVDKKLDDIFFASLNKLNALNLGIDGQSVLKQREAGESGEWLIPILHATKEKGTRHDNPLPDEMMTLKCFIAGAKSLDRERDAIISGINDQNIANKPTRRRIECYTFNNFDSHLSQEGQQAAFNKFIKEEADVVIFTLDEVVGGITKEEFSVAVEALKESQFKRPRIYVFSNVKNEGAIDNPSIQEVRDQVNSFHQYWIDYSSLEVLKLKLQLRVDPLYTPDVRNRFFRG